MGVSEVFDAAIADWRRERPDLDFSAMAPVTRILAAATLTRRVGEKITATEGLSFGEYEVLAVLRRNPDGAPLKAGTIALRTMISPGGLTNRLDRLQAAGLVTRRRDPADHRSQLVRLTAKGRRKVDVLITKISASARESFSTLSADEVSALVAALDAAIDQTFAGPLAP